MRITVFVGILENFFDSPEIHRVDIEARICRVSLSLKYRIESILIKMDE